MTPSDVKIVADNIDDFIEVPDGINRLRKAVLTLAVSGKLVPQIKKESTAQELYNQIQITRAKPETTGRKKKTGGPLPITEEEVPFALPRSWMWVRIGSISEVNPRSAIPDDTQVSFLPMARVFSEWGKNPDVSETRSWKSVKAGFTHIAEGDVILAKITPCFENEKSGVARGVSNGFAAGTTELHVFRTRGEIEPEYLLMVFKTPFFVEKAKGKMTGTAGQKRVPTDYVVNAVMPLPPLAEQKRIVEKVQSVMKQLDVLEEKKHERDEVRTRLARSAMKALSKGNTKVAFDQLTELIKTPADIKELENALLTLAVSGKLVPQDKKDGSVDLDTSVPSFGDAFDIPTTWKWAQLDEVCDFKYGYTDSAKDTGSARFVRITDMMEDGSINENEEKYVDLTPESEKYLLKNGDILTARIGATYGRTVLFKGGYKAIFASYLIRTDFDHNLIHPEFYLAFARSGWYWSQARSLVSGSAQPQFNANLIKKMFIPIPPVAEQKRIVKKVEEVTLLIRKLELSMV